MKFFTTFFVLLIFFFTCFSQQLVQVGTFEGSYTSPFKHGMFICQTGNQIAGSWDELGIIEGTVSDDGRTAAGFYWIAGEGPCVRGAFEFLNTPDGFNASFLCHVNSQRFNWFARKTSQFRPSNSQCAILSTVESADIQGQWTSSDSLFLDLCFRTPDDDDNDDDDETVEASYKRTDANGVVRDYFTKGYWYRRGKIFQGTWYTNLGAGALLMILRDTGHIEYFWWTGLVFNRGQTFIDGLQLTDSTRHGVGTFFGPRKSITAAECLQFRVLQPLVFKNLPLDDDDDYYYFIQTKYLDSAEFRYLRPSNSTSFLSSSIPFVLILIGLFCI